MSAPGKRSRLGWFAGAAGAVVVAGLGARLCPGTCTGCSSCIGSMVPMLGSAGVLGAAIVAGSATRLRRQAQAGSTLPETDAPSASNRV